MGGSIEDFDPGGFLYERDRAADRIAAAAEAARGLAFPFTLTARAENHIRENPDLSDTIARLQAFEEAGADVLFAPGLRSVEEIRAVCDAVSKPVNVLAVPGLSVAEIAEAGAQRISVGGGLTRVAIDAMAIAATAILDSGDLSVLAAAPRSIGGWRPGEPECLRDRDPRGTFVCPPARPTNVHPAKRRLTVKRIGYISAGVVLERSWR